MKLFLNILVFLSILLLILFIGLFDPEYLPRVLIAGGIAAIVGYSKSLVKFRDKYVKYNLKLTIVLFVNVVMLVGFLVFGAYTEFKSKNIYVAFISCSLIGVLSVFLYFVFNKKNNN